MDLVLLYGRGLGQFTEIILKIPTAARGLSYVRVNRFCFWKTSVFFSDLLYVFSGVKRQRVNVCFSSELSCALC